MADRTVRIRYEAITSGHDQAMRRMAQDAERTGGRLTQVARRNTEAFTAMGAGLAAAGAAAAFGLKQSLDAAISWESAFAGVRKTVDASEAEFARLSDGFRNLALEIPLAVEEIAGIGEAAGQLGIETQNIEGFTRTMADLGVATNLSSDQAATALARLANITQMPQTEFDRLGSTVVALGNNLATTESEIVEMGLRIAGAGAQIGLAESEILGVAAALSSVGIEAEAGGSAISRVMIEIASQVETGGEKLDQFAAVAGMSAEQFSERWREDAAGALVAFIEGLGRMDEQGGSTLQTLEALGITEIRMRDALLRSAGAGDLLSESIGIANSAWDENLALTEEAEQRYSTTESRLMLARNAVNDLAISIGESLTPMVGDAADFVGGLASALSDLPAPVQATLAGIGGLTTAVGLAGGAFLLALPRIAQTRAALAELASQGITVRTSLSRVASFMTGPWGIALAAGAVALYGVSRAASAVAQSISDVEAALASGDLEQGVQALVDEFAALGQPGDLGTEIGRFFRQVVGGVTLADERAQVFAETVAFLAGTSKSAALQFIALAEAEGLVRTEADGSIVALTGYDSALALTRDEVKGLATATDGWLGAMDLSRARTEGVAAALDGASGRIEDHTEALAALEEQYAFVGEALGSLSSPLSIYQDKLAEVNESERAAHEKRARLAEESGESIEGFTERATLSLEEYRQALVDDIANTLEWKENLLWVHRTMGPEVAAHFASMGTESNHLMAEMRTLNAEEARKMAEEVTGYNQAMSDDVERILQLSLANQQGIVDVGTEGVVQAIATQLDIGVTEVAGIGKRYGGELGRAIEPLLMAIGDAKTRQAVRAYINGQPITGLNAGGPVPGSGPDRDTVPALLTPGEFVTRRSAVSLYGADVFEALNERRVDPEVARRAILGLNRGGLGDVQGLNTGGLVALGRWLQSQGARVSEHPAFGGVRGRHSPRSYHYRGDAIDVNYGPGGENAIEKAFFDRIVPQIRAGLFGRFAEILWRVAGHFNHLHVGGSLGGGFAMDLPKVPDFPFAGIIGTAPSVFGDLRGRMQRWVDQQFAFTGGGGGSAPGDLRAHAQERLREYGWADQWWALDRLVQKESGWNPRAQNPRSTAFGLFQFLDSTWATVGARKTADPHAQIDAGLRYIAQRYGSPAAALAFHNRNGWYNEGGEVLPTGVYDAGGFLPQGASIAINNTGAPEPVGIDYDRLGKAVAKALSASGVGDSVTFVTGVSEARLLHILEQRDRDKRIRAGVRS